MTQGSKTGRASISATNCYKRSLLGKTGGRLLLNSLLIRFIVTANHPIAQSCGHWQNPQVPFVLEVQIHCLEKDIVQNLSDLNNYNPKYKEDMTNVFEKCQMM